MIEPEEFIRTHTVVSRAPLVPELALYLATEITPIWEATEDWLQRAGIEPPFWAFAWPGAQALARLILDRPELVRNRRVLDFGAGGGLAAIACAQAEAHAEAADIDPLAIAAVRANASLNGLNVDVFCGDVVGQACRWEVILCGDVCYEAPMARHILPWLRSMAHCCEVYVADPGRAYVPTTGLSLIATYTVPTSAELEDREERQTRIYRLHPGPH